MASTPAIFNHPANNGIVTRRRRAHGPALALALCLPLGPALAAPGESVVYSFASTGYQPLGGLAQGKDGNFYGTVSAGGAFQQGAFFMLTPAGSYTLLHSFDGTDGGEPEGQLALGGDGNFYGVTLGGGAHDDGTVFKVTPAGVLTVLYSFAGSDGKNPVGGLTLGSDGSFYGTTNAGGSGGLGAVFKITTAGALTTLHSFSSDEGSQPYGALAQGTDGNFYGTTSAGGAHSEGSVFKITPAGSLSVLHSFDPSSEGYTPQAGLVQAADGNFYGTTTTGGSGSKFTTEGTVFRITPAGTLTTLYSFGLINSDGSQNTHGYEPDAALSLGGDGNLYGSTLNGGAFGGGTLFSITTGGSLTTLYTFSGGSGDGAGPDSPLLLAADGNFYGTTENGGVNGGGTVFKLSGVGAAPPAAPVLNAPVAGDGQVALSWSAVSGVSSYSVYQGTAAGGESSTPVKTGISGTGVTLTGLSDGITYYFKVGAAVAGASGTLSNEVSATPLAVPGRVSGLAAHAGNAQVQLSWNAASGATGYNVYQGKTAGGETPVATGVSTNSYTATGLSNGSTYYFKVAALNSSGTGPQSSEVSATPIVSSSSSSGGSSSSSSSSSSGSSSSSSSGSSSSSSSSSSGGTTSSSGSSSGAAQNGSSGGGAVGMPVLTVLLALAAIRRRRASGKP